jgi:hypothetical protein
MTPEARKAAEVACRLLGHEWTDRYKCSRCGEDLLIEYTRAIEQSRVALEEAKRLRHETTTLADNYYSAVLQRYMAEQDWRREENEQYVGGLRAGKTRTTATDNLDGKRRGRLR